MAHDKDKPDKPDKFEFTTEGEEVSYIGLDEARLLAMQAANENPGDYGRRYSDRRMAFAPLEDEETDEYYRVVLALRPQGLFTGTPGKEEFYVEKLAGAESAIAYRQLLAVPIPERKRRPIVVLLAVALLVVVVASGVVGGLYIGGVLPITDASEDVPVEVAIPPQAPTQPASTATAEAAIFPQSPALLVSPDNSVIINIPVGSVAEQATLHYEPVNPQTVPELADGYTRVLRAFDLTLTDTQQVGAAVRLEQAITVTLALRDADIRLARGDGKNLIIQHFKIGQNTGEPLATQFDPQNMTVTAEVTSLSIFALTVKAGSPPQALNSPTGQGDVATKPPAEVGMLTPPVTLTPALALGTFPTSPFRPRVIGLQIPSPTAATRNTPTPTARAMPTPTPTPGDIPSGSLFGRASSLITPLPSPTTLPIWTAVPTVIPTSVPTHTSTPAPTDTPTPTPTPTATQTPTPTRVPTRTPTPSQTASPTATPRPALYTLAVATLPETAIPAGVQVTGFGLYIDGTSVVVTATERTQCRNDAFFQFSHWEGVDGDPNASISHVVMTHSREVVAVYEVINCATPTPTPVPNLRPGTPDGWDAPLVLSSKRATLDEAPPSTDASVNEDDPLYAHWAVVNDSLRDISTQFNVALEVDGTVVQTFPVPRLGPGEYVQLLNIPLTMPGIGQHQVTLIVDSSEDVLELNEAENSYSAHILLTFDYRIAFTSNRDGRWRMYVINADDSEPTPLSNNEDWSPSWSPDGTRIVFHSQRGESNEIYTMNADGSGLTRLTYDDARDSWYPVWSRDGTKIAFNRMNNNQTGIAIWTMNADGSGQTRLTSKTSVNDRHLAWSPDGTKVAFTSRRDGSAEIYTMNADGSGQTRLITTNSGYNAQPAWSPDGTKITFHSNDEIYVINLDGSRLMRLTFNDKENSHPDWSPDGTKIVFTSRRDDGDREIYVMNADGSGHTRLTNNRAEDWFPSWSPR